MALPDSPRNGTSLFHGLFSAKLLPIAGACILLLLGAMGTLVKAQVDDHQRWLIYLQQQHDIVKYEQGRRTTIIEAAAKTADIVQEIRIAVAEIRQQQLASAQILLRLEQLQRRELRTLEDQ